MNERFFQTFGRLTGHITNSGVLIVTAILLTIYAAALSGKFSPLRDLTAVSKLEPVLYAFIGYCFAFFSARQNQKNLTSDVVRLEQRAESAQFVRERIAQEREALEERIKNATSCLNIAAKPGTPADPEVLAAAVRAAVAILRS